MSDSDYEQKGRGCLKAMLPGKRLHLLLAILVFIAPALACNLHLHDGGYCPDVHSMVVE